MADTVSKEKRSQIMSRVKSKDSRIEIDLRKALWKKGIRFRKNALNYYGKPDIALPKYKAVIFIDSCFWHGCRWHCRMPSTNQAYWKKKIARNKKRDKDVNQHYKKESWQVIRIWEHDIKKIQQSMLKKVVSRMKNAKH